MSNLKMSEIKDEKHGLEMQIRELINNFNETTGLEVESIEVVKTHVWKNGAPLPNVKVKCVLE